MSARPLALVLRAVADIVLPRDCPGCDSALPVAHPSAFCPACTASLAAPPAPLCSRCGASVASASTVCSTCARHPPWFTTARAAAVYRPAAVGLNPLARAIHRLKYDGRRGVAGALVELLADRWPYGTGVLLVPVPLHPARLRRRGYNQAALLARALGRRRGLAVDVHALRRTRATDAQPGLDAAARRANLRRAFEVPRPAHVAGRHVVVVDDVVTSGATADACARALCVAGAARVDVWSIGRVP